MMLKQIIDVFTVLFGVNAILKLSYYNEHKSYLSCNNFNGE